MNIESRSLRRTIARSALSLSLHAAVLTTIGFLPVAADAQSSEEFMQWLNGEMAQAQQAYDDAMRLSDQAGQRQRPRQHDNTGQSYGTADDTTTAISPGVQSTMDMINGMWSDLQHDFALSDRAARGDAAAAREWARRQEALRRRTMMLEGMNAGDNIRNSVADSQRRLQDRNTASQYRQWADSEDIETQSQLDKAAGEMRHGGDSYGYFENAKRSRER